MRVWVVYCEYNRGWDLEGSASLVGVYATEAEAEEAAKDSRAEHRGMNCPVYSDPDPVENEDEDDDDDPDWGVDVHVEPSELALPVAATEAAQ